jgi:hypothetical protein
VLLGVDLIGQAVVDLLCLVLIAVVGQNLLLRYFHDCSLAYGLTCAVDPSAVGLGSWSRGSPAMKGERSLLRGALLDLLDVVLRT